MDLSTWLRNLGLGQYEQAFRDNAIGPDVLLRLTTEDLKELGVVSVGHRRKIARRDCRLARLRLARVR
jgi:hypothetical protein